MYSDKLSRFCHIVEVEKGKVYAVYNSLWLRTVFVEKEMLPFVTSLQRGKSISEVLDSQTTSLHDASKEVLKLLKRERFFDTEGDKTKISELRDGISFLPISLLYLMVTLNCNLACNYPCYLSKALCPKDSKADMSIDTARKGIDMFLELIEKQGVEDPQIVIYGGEPLANLETTIFAIEYARRKIPNVEININTNGTLIDSNIAEVFVKYNVVVSVSLDGLKKIHDAHRIDRSGRGSFDRVIAGYNTLVKHGVNVGISCTITPENVETLADTTLWFIRELGAHSLGFNLMIGSFGDKKSMSEYADKAANALIRNFKITREMGIYEDRMMRRVSAFSEGNICINDCAGCGQQIVLTPNDTLGVCQGFLTTGENFFPLDETLDPLTHPLWAKWRNRSPFNMQECLGCEALGICGGGCPYNSLQRKGDMMLPDEINCKHVKETLRFLIQDLWSQVQVN